MFGKYSIPLVLLLSFIGSISCDSLDCRHGGVGVMKKIYHCCKHPEGHNEIAEKCSTSTGFILPSANQEAMLDLTPENLIKASCFSECVFNASRFINNGVIDINSIREAITNDHVDDQEYIIEILNAFDQCHSTAEEKKAAILKSDFVAQHLRDKCQPMPGVILSCVILKFFKNCPSSRWTQNEQCNDAKTYLNSCENKFG